MINIRNVDDPFERYQMPDIVTRTKNNNLFVQNVDDICVSLATYPEVLAKYMGKDISTMVKYTKDHELQISGNHPLDTVRSSIRGFIDQYVLCPDCGIPELNHNAIGKKLHISCHACGFSEEVRCSDNKIFKQINQIQMNKRKILFGADSLE